MARGPAYPFVSLEEALGFSAKLYQFARRSPVKADSVIEEAWSYSISSSGGRKTLAALRYFGLIEDVSSSEAKLIKLSDRAYRILVDENSSDLRRQALHEAVLSPKAYLYCWEKWGSEIPPSMRSTLIFEEGFIDSTVDSFIADYKASISFAGLLDEAKNGKDKDGNNEPSESTPPGKRAEPIVQEPISNYGQSSIDMKPGNRQDIFSLSEGIVRIEWPEVLSSESFQDVVDWLEIIKRKISRNVKSQKMENGSQPGD